MSTAKFNEWQNPDGTENYKTRAWVNFNGTGVVAIRASGNVASITDNGVGNYTVNFATAMPDANYAVTTATTAGPGNGSKGPYTSTRITSSVVIIGLDTNGSLQDQTDINVAIIR